MRSLKDVNSMKKIHGIIAEEEHKATTVSNHLPLNNLVLVNDGEKAILYSFMRDEMFLHQNRDNIHELENRILDLYWSNGIKYREDLEGNHLSALRHLIKTTDIDFDQAFEQAQKAMFELPDGIFTLTFLYQFLEEKICVEQTQMTMDEFLQ